jgi:hypothetical protein
MNFIKKLLTPRPSNPGKFHLFTVKSNHCGEFIQGQVNVNNEPSLEFDEKGRPFFIFREVLTANQMCFQQIEVILKFNDLLVCSTARSVAGNLCTNSWYREDLNVYNQACHQTG